MGCVGMRAISWNLKDLGTTATGIQKLARTLPYTWGSGLGNTVLDYIVNLVTAAPIWQAYAGAAPADVFLVIELVSGGTRKGDPVQAGATPTLTTLVTGLNAAMTARGLAATYQYAFVPALITGTMESVGIIYNTRALAYAPFSARVLRDTGGRFLLPRAPFYATFTTVPGGQVLDVVGIHSPPPKGKIPFRPPIQYARKLTQVPQVNQVGVAPQRDLLMAGDYNCDDSVNYVDQGGNALQPFTTLIATYAYATQLPVGSRSSLRITQGTAAPPTPNNYLSAAYDNVLYKFAAGPAPAQRVLDLIGNARNTAGNAMYPAQLTALFDDYWTVSDHFPVDITF